VGFWWAVRQLDSIGHFDLWGGCGLCHRCSFYREQLGAGHELRRLDILLNCGKPNRKITKMKMRSMSVLLLLPLLTVGSLAIANLELGSVQGDKVRESTALTPFKHALNSDIECEVFVSLTALVRDSSTDQTLRGLSVHVSYLHGLGIIRQDHSVSLVSPDGRVPIIFDARGLDTSVTVSGLSSTDRPADFQVSIEPIVGLMWGDVEREADILFSCLDIGY